VSLVRFKTGLEDKNMVESMTVFNSREVDTKKQPMFFGQPLGIQRYDSYKYPIFDKLTTQQLGYYLETRRGLSSKGPRRLPISPSRTKAYLYK